VRLHEELSDARRTSRMKKVCVSHVIMNLLKLHIFFRFKKCGNLFMALCHRMANRFACYGKYDINTFDYRRK